MELVGESVDLGPSVGLTDTVGFEGGPKFNALCPPYATRFNYSHIAMHGLLTIIKNWSSDCIFKYCEH